MAKQFLGKVAIITGSSSGIGRETAVLFAEQGAKLTITGRNSQALEDVKTKLVAAGLQSGDVLIVQGNLIEESVQKRLVEETVSKFGQIDILVNNAGSLAPDNTKTLGFNQSMDEWDFTMDLNLKSVAQLSRLAMPHLIKTKGSIVNVSSIGSTNYNAAFPYYCVAKAGVDHLTRCLAMAFIDKGVRVNAVNPGLVHTGLMNKQGFTDEQAEKYCEMAKDRTKIPAGRAAHPREIGELIAFLADSKKSDYIMGQCIVIDGGRSMARTPLLIIEEKDCSLNFSSSLLSRRACYAGCHSVRHSAYDTIEWNAVWNSLQQHGADQLYIEMLRKVYQQAGYMIKVHEDLVEIDIKRGVRQGYVLSPPLFNNAVLEDIFRRLNWDKFGFNINGRKLNHLRYADDVVLVGKSLSACTSPIMEVTCTTENRSCLGGLELQELQRWTERDSREPRLNGYPWFSDASLEGLGADCAFSILLTWFLDPNLLFPLPGATVEGLFKYLGKDAGFFGLSCVLEAGLFTLLSVNSCCVVRYFLMYQKPHGIERYKGIRGFLWYSTLLGAGAACFFISFYYLTISYEELYDYAVTVNSTRFLEGVNPNTQLIAFALGEKGILGMYVGTFIEVCLLLLLLWNSGFSSAVWYKLKQNRRSMSAETFKMQKSLTIVLVLQAVIPYGSLCIPVCLYAVAFGFEAKFIYESPIVEAFLICVIGCYPFLSSLLFFFFIKAYRKYAISVIKRALFCINWPEPAIEIAPQSMSSNTTNNNRVYSSLRNSNNIISAARLN